jgi:hypothetical protein
VTAPGSDHLDAETRAMLAKPVAERLAWFQTEFWIEYSAAEHLLDLFRGLVVKPRRARMAGYLITGESNNGKSAIALEFARAFPSFLDEEKEQIQLPVLFFEIPPSPTDSAILGALLDALGVPYRPKDPYDKKLSVAVDAMRTLGVRVFVLDELQRILGARREQRLPILDQLRYFSNQVQVPLIVLTTPRGAGVLASVDEMINRLTPMALPAWPLDQVFQKLLSSFELRLPLPKPSNLKSKTFAPLIHELTEGLLGEVYDLLELALRIALNTQQECLTPDFIRSLPWVKPSERKRRVVTAVRA